MNYLVFLIFFKQNSQVTVTGVRIRLNEETEVTFDHLKLREGQLTIADDQSFLPNDHRNIDFLVTNVRYRLSADGSNKVEVEVVVSIRKFEAKPEVRKSASLFFHSVNLYS